MKIFLIYGGRSAERDISVLSAFSIQNELYYERHVLTPIFIDQTGTWFKGEERTCPFETAEEMILNKEGRGEKASPSILQENDAVAIPCLHGPYGEDGTIQGLLEVLGVPYVGCGVLASAAGMDKITTKYLFQQIGLPQLPFVPITKWEWDNYPTAVYGKCEGSLVYPMFVKPANLGSSVGISKANDRDELTAAINLAFEFDSRIVVELGIEARELECAVLGHEDIHTSVVGELGKEKGFYDYDEKYINNDVQLIIPAPVSEEISQKIRQYAKEAFEVIDGSGLARCDFFLTANDEIYINEVNTFPGFTKFSMYPKLWEVTGLQYHDLIENLIELAIKRYKQKNALHQTRQDQSEGE